MPYLHLGKNKVVEGRRCLGCKAKYFKIKHNCDEDVCNGQDFASKLYYKERFETFHEIYSTCKTKRITMKEYLYTDFIEHMNKCGYAQELYRKRDANGTLGKRQKEIFTRAELEEIDGGREEDPNWGRQDANPCASEDDDPESPDSSETGSERANPEDPFSEPDMDDFGLDSDSQSYVDEDGSDDGSDDWTKPQKKKKKTYPEWLGQLSDDWFKPNKKNKKKKT